MTYSTSNERRFRNKVDKALQEVKQILDLTRTPRYAEDEDHEYDDKYGLVNFSTNTMIAAVSNVLEKMGLDESKLQELLKSVHNDRQAVTLRLAAQESCEFLHERTVDVESPHKYETESTETKTGGGSSTTKTSSTHKIITSVVEYHWKITVQYKIFCFAGTSSEASPVVLQSRSSTTTLITTGHKRAPLAVHEVRKPLDVDLTWLLEHIQDGTSNFSINREENDCRTPRRNEDVEKAFTFVQELSVWARACCSYLIDAIQNTLLGKHRPAKGASDGRTTSPQLRKVDSLHIFVPILPLMEDPANRSESKPESLQDDSAPMLLKSEESDTSSPLMSVADLNKFLAEQYRTMNVATDELHKMYPKASESGSVISVQEATVVLLCKHAHDLSTQYRECVDYVEHMLRKQLITAIGKEVHPNDFDEFMRFRNQRLFGPLFVPKPFCYAIRRPEHFPDGILSIENSGDKMEPIETLVNHIPGDSAPSMYIPLSAATRVEFVGDRFLHGWVQHRFKSRGFAGTSFSLAARARQFSSFLLLIGTISGPDEFSPKDAIILQNKDEVLIPLLLNELPTAKEFKDAISSLSPEQRRFAQSFRGMQLESSVFGVCVIQLKPQLEVLLGLPPNALTKEIKLTQDLQTLFIKYQIPPDLLSFDGSPTATAAEKVSAVKGHVEAVMEVIDGVKKEQLEEEVKKADVRREMKHDGFGGAGGGHQGHTFACAAPSLPQMSSVAKFRSHAMSFAPRSAAMSAASGPSFDRAELCYDAAPMSLAAGEAFDDAEDAFELCEEEEAAEAQPTEAESSLGLQTGDSGLEMAQLDFTALPKKLNKIFEEYDTDNALRTTIIKAGDTWNRKRQGNLLTKLEGSSLTTDNQKTEKNKAFDLLDAISRSGSLPIACAEMHVVMGVTHCFEDGLMETVIQKNVNPVERVEHSMLLIASTIHNADVPTLLRGSRQPPMIDAAKFPSLEASSEEARTDAEPSS